MKVSELSGALLDYWVAKVEGSSGPEYLFQDGAWHATDCGVPVFYSRDVAQAWPIIDRELISTVAWEKGAWSAYVGRQDTYLDVFRSDSADGQGSTALIAAMRAYVRLKFGDEVPDEVSA